MERTLVNGMSWAELGTQDSGSWGESVLFGWGVPIPLTVGAFHLRVDVSSCFYLYAGAVSRRMELGGVISSEVIIML